MVWIRLGFDDGNDGGALNGVGERGIEGISRNKGVVGGLNNEPSLFKGFGAMRN